MDGLHEFRWTKNGDDEQIDLRIVAKEDGSFECQNLQEPSQVITCPNRDEMTKQLGRLVTTR